MEDPQRKPLKSIPLYVALQSLTMFGCWGWFIGLWTFALSYDLGDLEWWLLVISACAGLYGLRPNLERAIDAAWLKDVTNTKALAERAAILRPIKRRIDLVFSLVVVCLLLAGLFLLVAGVVKFANV